MTGRRSRVLACLIPAMLAAAFLRTDAPGADAGSGSDHGTTAVSSEPIVFFDASDLFKLGLNDPRQRRLFWDESQLLAALEGLVNRNRPRLFIRYLTDPDDFWWRQMTEPGGWLAGRPIVRVSSLEELLARFHDFYHGSVVWDERVPATDNLAATIAGCDDLLPLRFDPGADSLYGRLTRQGGAAPVLVRLLRTDGSQMFTGRGTIPGTNTRSTGSAKCDAYLWLIKHYVKTGKANPLCMGYYVDSFWLGCWNASVPESNTLCNQDYVIANRGVLFDLDVWDDESPVDDPGQRPGTDAATLRTLLRAEYDRFDGNGIIQVDGFIPWAFKYTTFKSPVWASGGTHKPVPTEWECVKILSCFNACLDADALSLGALANASFYQHYPLAASYPQNPKPTLASMEAQGLVDGGGRVVPRAYVAFFVGDYDSSGWLYRKLPAMWSDPARGTVPLSWAFDPNLCKRFPLGMVYARMNRSKMDWFVAGDSGAGYLNPGGLTPPRAESGLPSGLAAWEERCSALYRQWSLTLTGFIVDGFSPGLSPAGMAAYSRFSHDGIVEQTIPLQGVYNGMPYLRMRSDIQGSPEDAAGTILRFTGGPAPSFTVVRSTLRTPTWHARVVDDLRREAGEKVRVVDLYSLLWLVREYGTQ